MTINNFDQRVSRTFRVPASRLAYLKTLEEKARQNRTPRKKNTAKQPA